MKTVSATIEIHAPPTKVWAVLTDLSRYRKWNPLFPEAAGEVAVGNMLTLRSVAPSGRVQTARPTVLTAEPGVQLRWRASIPGIIGGEHRFALSPVGGGTRVVQSETFLGILVPFCGQILARAEPSYRAVNEALKKRAEGRAR